MSVLAIQGLSVRLRGGGAWLLRDVSLEVARAEALGLVGESGAGKSMIGKATLGILPRAAEVVAGSILLDGVDLLTQTPRERRRLVGASCALIPQDPLTALNPSRRIGGQITDRLVDVLGWASAAASARARELLDEVQVPDPERALRAYPHELSGGMRQRVLIAAAFAAEPRLVVADEPTTALDALVQRQILRLVRRMQARHGTALLFVTHDLGVASKVCGRLAVLQAGRVVEQADLRAFFRGPEHPYARALLAASAGHAAAAPDHDPTPGPTPEATHG